MGLAGNAERAWDPADRLQQGFHGVAGGACRAGGGFRFVWWGVRGGWGGAVGLGKRLRGVNIACMWNFVGLQKVSLVYICQYTIFVCLSFFRACYQASCWLKDDIPTIAIIIGHS